MKFRTRIENLVSDYKLLRASSQNYIYCLRSHPQNENRNAFLFNVERQHHSCPLKYTRNKDVQYNTQ